MTFQISLDFEVELVTSGHWAGASSDLRSLDLWVLRQCLTVGYADPVGSETPTHGLIASTSPLKIAFRKDLQGHPFVLLR